MSCGEIISPRDFAESVAAKISNTTAYYHTGPVVDNVPEIVRGKVVGIQHAATAVSLERRQ